MSDKSAWTEYADLAIKLLGFSATALALYWNSRQLDISNRWKRKEFANTAIIKFLNDPYVRNALLMMDWRSRFIVLPEDHATMIGETTFLYEEAMLTDALGPATRTVNGDSVVYEFSNEEVAIRDYFDAFFSGIVQFVDLVDSKVMEHGDFKPYFEYWARLIDGQIPNKSTDALAAINGYINEYFTRDGRPIIADFFASVIDSHPPR